MTRDPRHDILFTPLQIGPKDGQEPLLPGAALQRRRLPRPLCRRRNAPHQGRGRLGRDLHRTDRNPPDFSEITPFIEQHLWDDRDIPALARMAEAMKSTARLAGIQLAYSGINGPNLYSREVPLAVTGGPILTFTSDPVQARTMDRQDIQDLRRWFKQRLPARASGGVRPDLPLRRAWLWHPAALPEPRHQPPHRRIRRQLGKPWQVPARSG
jgi:dimethylamine/trimethylamine dehydrogenase